MVNEEYEILPHKLLADLKYDVESLKKKLSEPDTKTNELILEIESLKDSINELQTIFQKALQEMKEEDPSQEFSQFRAKIEAVVSQNETIAKGMIAISDKLEDFMRKQLAGPKPMSVQPMGIPVRHNMGIPSTVGGPARMAPPLSSIEPEGMDLPPPPPSSGKRKGIF